jgi:hypothetical protein
MVTNPNIWATFPAMDGDCHTSRTRARVGFHQETLRESPGLVVPWNTGVLLASLTTRRQKARFKWLNKPHQINFLGVVLRFVDIRWGWCKLLDSRRGDIRLVWIYMLTNLWPLHSATVTILFEQGHQ